MISKKNFIEGDVEGIDEAHIGDEGTAKNQQQYHLKNGIIGNVKDVKKLHIGDKNTNPK